MPTNAKKNRLIIVSNRLPITVTQEDNEFKTSSSTGGLVTGLGAYVDAVNTGKAEPIECIWVGWPGLTVEDNQKEALKKLLIKEHQSYPVFLTSEMIGNFYHGFTNNTLWPLFHYFTTYTIYDEEYWLSYKTVNKIFCDTVKEIMEPGDIIWIQDYHLMLLPKMLREKEESNSIETFIQKFLKEKDENPTIGFFLHIPFPAYEIFQLLPRKYGKELLEGVLGADLAGFHTHEYAQSFLRCVLRILGYENQYGKIIMDGRIIKIDTYPMGIDFEKYYDAAHNEEVIEQENKLKKETFGQKLILSVDRLDYTKGLINRLLGFELFLDQNPHWHEKVTLILLVVPSRTEVEHYQTTKKNIDELVGRINSKFNKIGWSPIIYFYKSLNFNELVALYTACDIGLVTPLRDGMNLVSKEYLAARAEKPAVLILSEMAGSSKELTEAILINPNSLEEFVEAIKYALEMPEEEKTIRKRIMQNRIKKYNVINWVETFINNLKQIKNEQNMEFEKIIEITAEKHLKDKYLSANKRLIFLDYDGTLVSFTSNPNNASPSEELLKLIESLAKDTKNEIIIISGRPRDIMDKWLGSLNVTLAAEHGMWEKIKNNNWNALKERDMEWKSKIIPIFENYILRMSGSFIEEKDFSVVWHYRNAEPDEAQIIARELVDDLINYISGANLEVIQGSKNVEVRMAGFNKGIAVSNWLVKDNFDFIMAIGDDTTDEDMFKALPNDSFSIKVGTSPTKANYSVLDYSKVIKLIKEILR